MFHRPWIFRATLAIFSVSFLIPAVIPQPMLAQETATLSWAPNQESDLAGYKLYYGDKAGVYNGGGDQSSPISVGKITSEEISGLKSGEHYYFTITAVDFTGNESMPSEEVSAAIGNSTAPPAPPAPPATIPFLGNFDFDTDGFTYADDSFRGTNQPTYASGTHLTSGGVSGGALQVTLGGINSTAVSNMSGGWQRTFTVNTATNVTIAFRYTLTQSPNYESNELSQALASLDGILLTSGSTDYLAQVSGNGEGGSPVTTGWQLFETTIPLSEGEHTLILGGFNNRKTSSVESTTVLLDQVTIDTVVSTPDVSLTVDVTGSGSVISTDLEKIDCPSSTCTAEFPQDSTVTLTATPVSGWSFAGWSGACTGTNNCTVGMTTDQAVTAKFVLLPPPTHSLTVGITGSGSVISTDLEKIGCPSSTCTADFPQDSTVTLTATPASGWSFAGWSGACTGTNNCTVGMTTDQAVTAKFVLLPPPTHSLTVGITGSGSVISTDLEKIGCPSSTCTAEFPQDSTVTLTATPASGWSFAGWSGACTGTNKCIVSMTTSQSVTAVFSNIPSPMSTLPITADFDQDTDGFTYADDSFRSTNQPAYADGSRIASGGYTGGALQVSLGGINHTKVTNMSGGWHKTFTLATPTDVTIAFRYNLTQSPHYESYEMSQALVTLDGALLNSGTTDYLAQIAGNGQNGSPVTTNWQLVQVTIPLSAGDHTLALGGFNNRKSASDEVTTVLIDQVTVAETLPTTVPFTADFDQDTDGFTYADDSFRSTNQPAYANGSRIPSGGYTGGALQVSLGGINHTKVTNMSGGWHKTFTLATPTDVTIAFRYNLTQSPHYESYEMSQALVTLDGALLNSGTTDYLAQIAGNGQNGSPVTTNWQLFQVTIPLSAGDHTLALGGFNNRKSASDEVTTVLIDQVTVTADSLAEKTTLLSSDFNNGDLSAWTIVDEGTHQGPSAWSAATGALVQNSNIYTLPGERAALDKRATHIFYNAGMGWTNYQVEFTVRSDDNDAIGVMFRYKDSNNYYRFSWDRERNYRRLVKCENGVFSLLAEDPTPYQKGKSYQIEVGVQGHQSIVTIDGAQVFSVNDTSLSTGTIAFYSWANRGSLFKDIRVVE